MSLLYDSKGKLTQATHPFLFVSDEDIGEVEDFLEENGLSGIEIKDDLSFLTLYQVRHWNGDILHKPEEAVVGFRLMKNQQDGEWCGFEYFSTTKERFEDGDYGLRINSDSYLVMSARDESLFPQIAKFERLMKSHFNVYGRDCHSIIKNIYIADEVSGKTDRGKVWEYYNIIKAESTHAHYRGNTIYFSLKGGTNSSARVTTVNGRTFVVNSGNYYLNPEAMLKELKNGRGYNRSLYGNDKSFEDYVMGRAPLMEKEKEEDLER